MKIEDKIERYLSEANILDKLHRKIFPEHHSRRVEDMIQKGEFKKAENHLKLIFDDALSKVDNPKMLKPVKLKLIETVSFFSEAAVSKINWDYVFKDFGGSPLTY